MDRRTKVSGLGLLLRGTGLASLLALGVVQITPAHADTLTWDAGTPGGGTIEPADGDWNNNNGNRPWNNVGGNDSFDAGDDVIFDNAGGGTYTITTTVQVAPTSVTFATDGFTIIDDGSGGINAAGGNVALVVQGDVAIDAELSGDFTMTGTAQLTYGGTTDNLGTVTVNSGTLVNNGLMEDSDAADVSVIDLQGGTFTNNGTAESVALTTGTFTNDAAAEVGNFVQVGGDSNLAGTVTEDVDLQGGTADITGPLTITGDLTTAIDLTVDNDVDANSVDSTANVTVDGATLTITGAAQDYSNNGGTLTVETASTVDGDVNNVTGTVDVNGGEITGTLTNADIATLAGTVGAIDNNTGGDVTFDGDTQVNGTIDNADAMDIDPGVTVTATGMTTNENGGVLGIGATSELAGDLTNQNGAQLDLGGTVTGTVTNDAGATLDVIGTAAQVDGDLDTAADITIAGGEVLTVTGTTTVQNPATVTIDATGELASDTTIENGGTVDLAGTLTGNVTNDNGGTLNAVGTTGQVDGTLDTAGDVNVGAGEALNVTGATTVQNNGTLTVDATGTFTGDTTVENGGQVDLGGTLTGTVGIDAGGALDTTSATAQVDGPLTTAGDVNVGAAEALSVTGATTVQNNGTLTVDATGAFTGDTTVENGGQVDLGGTLTGNVALETGSALDATSNTAQLNGTLDAAGDVNVGAAEVLAVTGATTIQSGGTLTVDATGEFDGTTTVESGGQVDLGGTHTGNVTVDAGGALDTTSATALLDGTLTTAGAVTVNGGDQLTVTGLTTVQSGALLAVDGTMLGDITVDAGGALTLTDTLGSLGDPTTLLNNGDIDLAGTVNGAVTNNLTMTVSGATDITGAVTNAGTGTLDANAALTWGTLTNDGIMNVAAGVTIGTGSGLLTNNGTINFGAGSTVASGLSFSGTMNVDGTVDITSGLTGSGIIDLGAVNDSDALNITGNANLAGTTFQIAADFSNATTNTDMINVTGTLSGNLVFNFTNTAGATYEDFGATTQTFLTYGTNAFTYSATGLGAVGTTIYYVDDTVAGQLSLASGTNPNLGGLAGAVVLTQSLIGSVVNRPSSPFVTGLAVPGDDPCGPGAWGRFTGGRADATGGVIDATASFDYDSSITADYGGIQLGADFSCSGGYYNGWDLAFGGILGVNVGKTTQPLYAFDASGNPLTSTVLSNNNTDFTQSYAGAYISAYRDNLLMDLQYRVEQTGFELSNTGTGAARAGIIDQSFDSTAQTLSGSVSYVFPVNEELGINIVPTAGFSYTQTSVDPITVDYYGDGSNSGRLEIEDFSNQIGFVGASVSRTVVQPSGNSALTYFGTATYYKDFSDDISTLLYDTPGDVSPEAISTENLGQYGELSLGVNYTRLLEPGSFANARQLNASVRLDGRTSGTLDSWGITGQVRINF